MLHTTHCSLLTGCWLLATSYRLLFAAHSLLITGYLWLLTVHWLLVITYSYTLLISTYYLLPTTHWLLVTGELLLLSGEYSMLCSLWRSWWGYWLLHTPHSLLWRPVKKLMNTPRIKKKSIVMFKPSHAAEASPANDSGNPILRGAMMPATGGIRTRSIKTTRPWVVLKAVF